MYSDTSCTHAGGALWQIQDGKPRLLGYTSKTLPAASKNYSVTELEMTGMLINLHSWHNYIHGIEIDVAVDHKAVVQIMKAKHPPHTDWVSVLLGKLLDKPFDLYYVKGKDLILADCLSRIKTDRSDPSEVIPISFINERQSLGDLTYHLNSGRVTRSAAKYEGLSMPIIHGHSKQLDPHCKPEHQTKIAPATTHPSTTQRTRPRMDPSSTSVQKHTPVSFTTSRKLIKRSIKTLNKDSPQSSIDHKIPPLLVPIVPWFDPLTGSKDPPFVPATPNHVEPAPVKEGNEQPHTEEPQLSPPSYAPVTGETVPGQPVDPDLDIGGPLPNYHDQVEVVVHRPLQEELDAPIPLHKLVDTSKISQRRLPRQSKIDRILKEIVTKILRQVHLPTFFQDLHAANLDSPQFKDVYTFLLHHKTPSNPRKCTQVLAQASDYMVIDQLLFKITRDHITQKFKPLLCIPTLKINLLLHYFHSSLLGGQMGITKMYVTISQRFFCPNLAHHIRAYIVGCHI